MTTSSHMILILALVNLYCLHFNMFLGACLRLNSLINIQKNLYLLKFWYLIVILDSILLDLLASFLATYLYYQIWGLAVLEVTSGWLTIILHHLIIAWSTLYVRMKWLFVCVILDQNLFTMAYFSNLAFP